MYLPRAWQECPLCKQTGVSLTLRGEGRPVFTGTLAFGQGTGGRQIKYRVSRSGRAPALPGVSAGSQEHFLPEGPSLPWGEAGLGMARLRFRNGKSAQKRAQWFSALGARWRDFKKQKQVTDAQVLP